MGALIEIKDVEMLIDLQQKKYLQLVKDDKSKRKEVSAILTATTLIKMELNNLPKTAVKLPK